MAAKKKSARKKVPAAVTKALAGTPREAATTLPGLPVEELLREGKNLVVHAEKNKAKLRAVMEEPALLMELAPRLEHLRLSEDAWGVAKVLGGADPRPRALAEETREELLASARYVLRKDAAAQRQLEEISAGDGLADLIDDLFQLAAILEKHPRVARLVDLPALGKDVVAGARRVANQLDAALSEESDDSEKNEALAERNRAAWLVEEAMREVREAGRFVFRKDAKLRRHFQSAYSRRRRARHNERLQTEAPSVIQ